MASNWGFFGGRVGEPLYPDPECEVCEGTGYRFKTSKIYCDCLRPPAPSPHGSVFYAKMPEHAHTFDVPAGQAFGSPEVSRAQFTSEMTLCCDREVCDCGENLRMIDGEPLNMPGTTLSPDEQLPSTVEDSPFPFPGRSGDLR